ncbi:MAG: tail fiber domain-containing protein, partial [Pyrinomonadaceae bacterium]
FVGVLAGADNTIGNSNTYLGYNAKGAAGIFNATAIGANALAGFNNQIVIGTDTNFLRVPGSATIDGNTAIGGTLTIRDITPPAFIPLCLSTSDRVGSCSSSLRYKTNIAPFKFGLNLVNRLQPITFDWKEGGMRDLGLGAEDVAAVEPLLVIYDKDGQVKGVKYDRLGVVLLNAVKEQQAQIEQQQKQLQEQKFLIEGLKKVICQTNAQADVCKEVK